MLENQVMSNFSLSRSLSLSLLFYILYFFSKASLSILLSLITSELWFRENSEPPSVGFTMVSNILTMKFILQMELTNTQFMPFLTRECGICDLKSMIISWHHTIHVLPSIHVLSEAAVPSNMHKSYSLFHDKYPQRLSLPVNAGSGQRLVNLAAYVCPSTCINVLVCMYVDVCGLCVCQLTGICLTEWELMSPRWDTEQIGVWAPLSWLINLLFNSFTVCTNMATLPGWYKGHLRQILQIYDLK